MLMCCERHISNWRFKCPFQWKFICKIRIRFFSVDSNEIESIKRITLNMGSLNSLKLAF